MGGARVEKGRRASAGGRCTRNDGPGAREAATGLSFCSEQQQVEAGLNVEGVQLGSVLLLFSFGAQIWSLSKFH